jgi:Family of unknown function (DUF6518)
MATPVHPSLPGLYRPAPRPIRAPRPVPGPVLAAAGVAAAALVGLVGGALTDLGQSRLPWAVAPLANSAGSWVLLAFVVALGARGLLGAVARSSTCLVGLVVGFYAMAMGRGVAVGHESVVFWTVAALAVGPLAGAAAGALRHVGSDSAAVGAGVLGGMLAGEAVYGLRHLPATSPGYWVAQFAVGSALAVGLAWWRTGRRAALALSVAAAGWVAVVVYGAYVAL